MTYNGSSPVIKLNESENNLKSFPVMASGMDSELGNKEIINEKNVHS